MVSSTAPPARFASPRPAGVPEETGTPGSGRDEFALIDLILAEQGGGGSGIVVGAGDDAAVVEPSPGNELVVSVDTLVEGVHFLPGTPPGLAVQRAVGVSLSDLAAMGADAGPCLLSLTHPALTPDAARAVGRGFARATRDTGASLVGGNLARGPFSVSVTVQGWVPAGAALLRAGARPGDVLCVSGVIGAGAAGLEALRAAPGALREDAAESAGDLLRAYLTPTPRLRLGRALRGVATACIDVSDGLLADLGHVLRASGVAAEVDVDRVPTVGARDAALVAGDDYELLFALPPERVDALPELVRDGGVAVTEIGRIAAGSGLRLRAGGESLALPDAVGWKHFA
jgi:thiamine-monophosphate kinase